MHKYNDVNDFIKSLDKVHNRDELLLKEIRFLDSEIAHYHDRMNEIRIEKNKLSDQIQRNVNNVNALKKELFKVNK